MTPNQHNKQEDKHDRAPGDVDARAEASSVGADSPAAQVTPDQHQEPFDVNAEREHLEWLETLKASDMDGISAHNLVIRYRRLFEQLQAVERECGQAWTEYNDSEAEKTRLIEQLQTAQNILTEERRWREETQKDAVYIKRERDRLLEQLEVAQKSGGWAAAEKAARRADELQEQLERLTVRCLPAAEDEIVWPDSNQDGRWAAAEKCRRESDRLTERMCSCFPGDCRKASSPASSPKSSRDGQHEEIVSSASIQDTRHS